MAEKKETEIIETVVAHSETTDVIDQARGFWDKFSKPIIYVSSAIILGIIGWYSYQNFVVMPKEKKASEMIFQAETIFDKMATSGFSKDSVNIVLNGGSLGTSNVTGILKVISNYGGTETGNRARYIAGASYLHIKEFDKAIKYLKEFNAHGATQIESKAYLLLGHAYAEKKQTTEALDYYNKAASVNAKDESSTPTALLMAATYAEAVGKNKEAIDLFTKLKKNYPANTAVTSGEVEKHLALLGVFE